VSISTYLPELESRECEREVRGCDSEWLRRRETEGVGEEKTMYEPGRIVGRKGADT